ncbi:hypothetical protein HPB50_028365 [Hyalomma asiaticum]|nr:hypothetical protein HPB50_028365 [Hyalomma asiaticum]
MNAPENGTGDSVVPPETQLGIPSEKGTPSRYADDNVATAVCRGREQQCRADVSCQETVKSTDKAVQCELYTAADMDGVCRHREARLQSLRRTKGILRELLDGPSHAEH